MGTLRKGTEVITPQGRGVITKTHKGGKSTIDGKPLGKRYTVRLYAKRGEFSWIVFAPSELKPVGHEMMTTSREDARSNSGLRDHVQSFGSWLRSR